MKKVKNKLSPNPFKEVFTVFRVLRGEGFSAEEIGDILGVKPEKNIEIGITLPQRKC